MKKFLLLIVISSFLTSILRSQVSVPMGSLHSDKFSLGIGFGLDYGGIGGNLLAYPQRNIGLFVGAGYALAGVGFNCGIKARIITKNYSYPLAPFIVGMYGYNAVIKVSNAEHLNKIFFGPTVGFGFDLHPRNLSGGYFSFGFLLPIRGDEVNNYIQNLEDNHNVTFERELLPFGISIGFRVVIK